MTFCVLSCFTVAEASVVQIEKLTKVFVTFRNYCLLFRIGFAL